MLGLFVGCQVLARFVCAVCNHPQQDRCIPSNAKGVCVNSFARRSVEEEKRAHDQTTMTVILLSRQTLVSSRIGSWCSDWEWLEGRDRRGGNGDARCHT